MTVFEAIVLGIVQGLTEFLPISSSAHLLLVPPLLGWTPNSLAFDVALHVGTLAAVLWFFWAEWIRLARAGWAMLVSRRIESEDQRRVVLLVVATAPGAVAALLFQDAADTVFRDDPAVNASALIIFGILLWVVDRARDRARSLTDARWSDALVIGIAQAFALVPGVSRSGATMTAGRFLRFDRSAAATFSFLMSMPITAAAAAVKVPEAIAEGGFSLPLVAGVVASAVSGWFAIAVLLRFITRHGYGVFALYRVLFGILVFWLLVFRG